MKMNRSFRRWTLLGVVVLGALSTSACVVEPIGDPGYGYGGGGGYVDARPAPGYVWVPGYWGPYGYWHRGYWRPR